MHTPETTNIVQSKNWYALKVFYNRVFAIEEWLHKQDIETYIPTKVIERKVANKSVRRRVPAISSLMFIYCNGQDAIAIQKELMGKAMIYTNRNEKEPTAIPDNQMRTFIAVTSVEDLGMEYYGDVDTEWSIGERVRVTDGIFKGAEGYIKRIKGDRRLIVAIEGIVAVATSYIPHCFIEKI